MDSNARDIIMRPIRMRTILTYLFKSILNSFVIAIILFVIITPNIEQLIKFGHYLRGENYEYLHPQYGPPGPIPPEELDSRVTKPKISKYTNPIHDIKIYKNNRSKLNEKNAKIATPTMLASRIQHKVDTNKKYSPVTPVPKSKQRNSGKSPLVKPKPKQIGATCMASISIPRASVPGVSFPVVISLTEPVSLDVPTRKFRICIKSVDSKNNDCKLCTVRYGKGSTSFVRHEYENHTITFLELGGGKKCNVYKQSRTIDMVSEVEWSQWKVALNKDKSFTYKAQVIIIKHHIKIEKGEKVRVEADMILVKQGVKIEVSGKLSIYGQSSDSPTVITKYADEGAWGQFYVRAGGILTLTNVYLTQGGAAKWYGPSKSAAVIMVNGASYLNMKGGGLVDNQGKAFGANTSMAVLSNILVSRCDTGGYFNYSFINVTASHFLEIPNNKRLKNDKDNDALYLHMQHPASTLKVSHIHDSVFSRGDDTAIHQYGANVNIRNTIIDDFANVGVIAMGQGTVNIQGSFITNCQQGVQCGKRSPRMYVNDSILMSNAYSMWYGSTDHHNHSGVLHIEHTLSITPNYYNVKVWFTQGDQKVTEIQYAKFSCNCTIAISKSRDIYIVRTKISNYNAERYKRLCLIKIINSHLTKYSIFDNADKIKLYYPQYIYRKEGQQL